MRGGSDRPGDSMDNLTHTLFALTLARTPLGRAGRGTTATLLLASSAPDADGLPHRADPFTATVRIGADGQILEETLGTSGASTPARTR